MSREGKLHLVESYSGPRQLYKNVTNDSSFQALKEAAQKLHNKPRISEAVAFSKMKKILKENKIDETVQKRVLKGLQEAGANLDEVELWQFPVSKVNDHNHPNLNGRVYGKKLWEKVVNEQREVWQGGTGLANHPDDDEDGDFMKQSIVWLDGFIGDDDIIYGIGCFVGEGGALARQIISVGGRVGFSTSGYGDFLADGIEVDPDGYEIDRFADLVLNPSQGVFGDYTDSYSYNQSKKESVQKNKSLKENVMNLREDENIKAIMKAIEASDTVEQLGKIADDMGLEIKLQEGVTEDITGELTVKLIANVVAGWEDKDCTPENIQDVKDSLTLLSEKGINDSEIKTMFKNALDELEVSEDISEALLAEKQEESEEDETCPECGKDPCECKKEEDEEDTSDDSDDQDSDEDTEEDSEEEEDENEDDDKEVLEETLSLEDQLMVEHYSKALKSIKKKSNELWEEKIQELNSLTDKLQKTNLSEAVKTRLNAQTQKLVDSIMKEARAAISEGFKAKKICENLGIGSIAKLSNIKEKLEDFVALEECLGKATKEANKYKALYEAKSNYAISEAEEAFANEEKVKELQEKVANLNKSLKEANNQIASARKSNIITKFNSATTKKELLESSKQKVKSKARFEALLNKYRSTKETLDEAFRTIEDLKAEAAENRRTLSEHKTQIRKLKNQLTEAKLLEATLHKSKVNLIKQNKDLQKDVSNMKIAENRRNIQQRVQESRLRARKEEAAENFYDTSKMFRNSKGIENLLEEAGVKNKSSFKNLKTLREAENQILFSNELLDEAADHSRNQIRAPKESVQDLAELFD